MNAHVFDPRRKSAAGSFSRILPMDAELPPRRQAGTPTRQQVRKLFADICYVGLRGLGWFAVTGLATLGLYVLFFMALGNMTAEGFFAQLANLGDRFTAADAMRRGSFMALLGTICAVLFLMVAAARFRSLLAIFANSAPVRKDRS